MSSHNPHEIPIQFYHLVTRLTAVQAHVPGGRERFLARYPGSHRSGDVVLWCVMGAHDLVPLQEELTAHGVPEQDIFVGLWDSMFMSPPGEEHHLELTPWLHGRICDGRLWLRPKEDPTLTEETPSSGD